MSAVSHFIPPSVSVVLGWVAYLGCRLVKLDVPLDMDGYVCVDCDHPCVSLAKEKIVRVAIDPPMLKLVLF